MKQKIFTILLTVFVLMIMLTPLAVNRQGGFAYVSAQVNTNPAQKGAEATAKKAGLFSEKDPVMVAGEIIQFILSFLGVVFLLLLIYGGVIRMTAQGSPDKIKQSTGIITSAVVGLLIIMVSYGLTLFLFEQTDKLIKDSSSSGLGEETTPTPTPTSTPTPECYTENDCNLGFTCIGGECVWMGL